MTIAVIWQEDGLQWCAADTRLVFGEDNLPTTEIAAKIYAIPVVVMALDADHQARQPHYSTQFGFVYAGSVLPASMTAVTASTLLQKLVRPGDRWNPPTFEEIANVVCRLARRFMEDRRRFGGDGKFSAALFGWCPYANQYKVAYIDGRDDADSFRVELHYPAAPRTDGEPWIVFGSGTQAFYSSLSEYKSSEKHITKRVPRRVIDKMAADGTDQTVGGATSIGVAHQQGFDLVFVAEPIVKGQPAARRTFNGLDLDTEVGPVGQYLIGGLGIA